MRALSSSTSSDCPLDGRGDLFAHHGQGVLEALPRGEGALGARVSSTSEVGRGA